GPVAAALAAGLFATLVLLLLFALLACAFFAALAVPATAATAVAATFVALLVAPVVTALRAPAGAGSGRGGGECGLRSRRWRRLAEDQVEEAPEHRRTFGRGAFGDRRRGRCGGRLRGFGRRRYRDRRRHLGDDAA